MNMEIETVTMIAIGILPAIVAIAAVGAAATAVAAPVPAVILVVAVENRAVEAHQTHGNN